MPKYDSNINWYILFKETIQNLRLFYKKPELALENNYCILEYYILEPYTKINLYRNAKTIIIIYDAKNSYITIEDKHPIVKCDFKAKFISYKNQKYDLKTKITNFMFCDLILLLSEIEIITSLDDIWILKFLLSKLIHEGYMLCKNKYAYYIYPNEF